MFLKPPRSCRSHAYGSVALRLTCGNRVTAHDACTKAKGSNKVTPLLHMSHVAAEVLKSRSVPSHMLQLRCTNREVYQASRMKGMLRLAWPLQDDTTNFGSR